MKLFFRQRVDETKVKFWVTNSLYLSFGCELMISYYLFNFILSNSAISIFINPAFQINTLSVH